MFVSPVRVPFSLLPSLELSVFCFILVNLSYGLLVATYSFTTFLVVQRFWIASLTCQNRIYINIFLLPGQCKRLRLPSFHWLLSQIMLFSSYIFPPYIFNPVRYYYCFTQSIFIEIYSHSYLSCCSWFFPVSFSFHQGWFSFAEVLCISEMLVTNSLRFCLSENVCLALAFEEYFYGVWNPSFVVIF